VEKKEMSPVRSKCPICGLDPPLATILPRADQDVDDVQCRRCGTFAVCPGHISLDWNRGRVPNFLRDKGVAEYDVARADKLLRAYLSIYFRECTERGALPEMLNLVDAPQLERLAETYAYTAISAKPEKVLRLLEQRTDYPGKPAQFNALLDYPAAHAIDAGEFAYYIHGLAQAGYIQTADLRLLGPGGNYGMELQATITLSGWTHLASEGRRSRRAFVAMAFAPDLDSAFRDGIAPAIRDSNYEPVRVDRLEHNDKICDRIIAEIYRSRFMIADVTLQRQGVYYEAGFAAGLGLPVIWSCRQNDLGDVHFDTRQYNHIVWETAAELRTRLHDRISATIR
jgi:hypothetical protein